MLLLIAVVTAASVDAVMAFGSAEHADGGTGASGARR